MGPARTFNLTRHIVVLIWTTLLVALAIGASLNFLIPTDIVQRGCGYSGQEPCTSCGLSWGMFGIVEPTPCTNVPFSVFLNLVGIARMLAVVAALFFIVTVPTLIGNTIGAVLAWRRGERTKIMAIQFAALAVIAFNGIAMLIAVAVTALW